MGIALQLASVDSPDKVLALSIPLLNQVLVIILFAIWIVAAQPANDKPANAIRIAGSLPIVQAYDTAGATGGWCSNDVYFVWTATCTGLARLSSCGYFSGDPGVTTPYLSIRTSANGDGGWMYSAGSSSCASTSTTCNHTSTNLNSITGYVSFQQVRSGQEYYISAGTTGSPSQGSATFQLTCDPEIYDVVNDECATAISITDGNTTFEPTHATDSYTALPNPIWRDSWFTYTATCTGVATIRLVESSNSYPSFAVLNGSCTSATSLIGSTSGFAARNFAVSSGSTYIIRAGTSDFRTPTLSPKFSLSCGPPAANDLKTGALRIPGEGVFPYDTTGSTASTTNFCAEDVWFVWAATCTGDLLITSCGLLPHNSTNYPGRFLVSSSSGYFEGSCSSPYNGCLITYTNGQSKFQVVSGQDYFIQVSSYGGVGPGLMNVTCVPRTTELPNDECAGGTAVSGDQIFFDPTFATNPQTVPFTDPYRDQWFTWVATCSGTMRIISKDAGTVAVLTSCATVANPLAVTRYGSLATTTVVSGTTYILRAGVYYTTAPMIQYHFNISCLPTPVNDKPANAIPWPGTVGVYFNYSTDGASTDSCDNDLWYNWTATCTGIARLTACGSNQYSLYPSYHIRAAGGFYDRYSCSNVYSTCDPDALTSSYINSIQVFQGSAYNLILGSQNQGSRVAVLLTCELHTYNLPNDECTGATTVSNGLTTYDGTKATTPQIINYAPYRDQWFRYTATCDGSASFTLPPDPGRQSLLLRSSCTGTSNSINSGGQRSVETKIGDVYYISAGYTDPTYVNASSTFTISCASAPVNDLKTGALRITGLGPFTVSNEGATGQECSNDLWYVWAATCTGLARVTACGVYDSVYPTVQLETANGYNDKSCASASSTCNLYEPLDTGYASFLLVTAGTDYYIAAGSSTTGTSRFQITCNASSVAPPANDECTGAISITDGVTTFTNLGATNRQDPNFNTPYRDVWFSYTATCSGQLQLSVPNVAANTDSSVEFRDAAIGCDKNTYLIYALSKGGSQSLAVTKGKAYHVRAGVRNPYRAPISAGTFEISCQLPPPNDAPAGAIRISGEGDFPYNNKGASNTYPGCGNDVWFVWKSTCSGFARASSCKYYSTLATTYVRIFSAPPLFATDTPSCSSAASSCTHDQALVLYGPVNYMIVKQDVDYYISAGASTGSDNFTFTLSCEPATFSAPNDDCSNAVPISVGVNVTYNASTATTTLTTDTPPYRDVWFKFLSTCTGALTLYTEKGYTHVSVYPTCTSTSRMLAAFNGNVASGAVTTGTNYYIRAGASTAIPSPTEQGQFRVGCYDYPPNDKSSGATRITGEGNFTFNNEGAVYDSCPADVWFVWSATCTGLVKVGACGITDPTPATSAATFRVSAASGYVESSCSSASTSCSFSDPLSSNFYYMGFLQVKQGTDYFITVGSAGVGPGSFIVKCEPATVAPPANDECAAAVTISDGQTAPFNCSGATNAQTPNANSPYRDTWFSYTATCTGLVRREIVTTKGSFVAQTHVTCDQSKYIESYISTPLSYGKVVAGTKYYYRIGSSTPSQSPPSGTLTFTCDSAPVNDLASKALRITGLGPHTYSSVGAGGEECKYDVWYLWAATCTGFATVTTCGNYNETLSSEVGIFATSLYSEDWCKKGSATCTATDPYSDGYSSGLPVVQGTDYLIAASSTIPGPNQKFTIACEPLTAPLPANDECSAAIPIGDGELTFNNTFATNAQTDENFYMPYRDLWYVYTAPCTGLWTVTVSPPSVSSDAAFTAQTSCDSTSTLFSYFYSGTRTTTVVSGTKYYVRVGTRSPTSPVGEYSFSMVCVPPPPNDNLAGAYRITGEGSFDFNSTGATYGQCSNDVWFKWAAPCSGLARLTMCGSPVAGYTGIFTSTLYSETSCSYASSCDPDAPITSTSISIMQVVKDTDYYISVASGGSSGTFRLTCVPQVLGTDPNDQCSGAIAVTDGQTTFDNSLATNVQIGFTRPYRDLWYTYTATCNGSLAFAVDPTSFSAAVLTFTTRACDSGASSGVVTTTTIGTKYYIRAGTSNPREVGIGSFTITCVKPPINDERDGAIPISGTGVFDYNTTGATTTVCSLDVWYKWTASCTGLAKVSACGYVPAGYTPYLYFQTMNGYTESSCVSPTQTCSIDDAIESSSSIATLQVTAGTEYLISVGAQFGWLGDSFQIKCVPQTFSHPNDACSTAKMVTVGTHVFTNDGATNEQYSNFQYPYRDIWFKYSSSVTGSIGLKLEASSALNNLYVVLLTDGCTTANECVTAEQLSLANLMVSSGVVAIDVMAGNSYFFRLGSRSARDGAMTGSLVISAVQPPPGDGPKDATVIEGNGVFDYNTTDASTDGACYNDIWFLWTAPCTGLAFATACENFDGSTSYPYMKLMTLNRYSPDSCVSVSPSCKISSSIKSGDASTLDVQEGARYFLAVGTSGAPGFGKFTMGCKPYSTTLPAHDNCAGAVSIGDGTFSYDPRLATSTAQMVDENSDTPLNDLWYRYTATCDGVLLVVAQTSEAQPGLTIHEDDCTTVDSALAYASDKVGGIPVTQGKAYLIAAGVYNPPLVTAPISFTVRCQAAAANDKDGAPKRITGEGSFPFDTTGAATDICKLDVWYVWSATCTGKAVVTLCGATAPSTGTTYVYLQLRTVTGGYQTSCVTSYTACYGDNYDSVLTVTAGQDYHIAVGTNNWGNGTFMLRCDPMTIPPQPPNEDCTGATTVSDGTTEFTPSLSSTSGSAGVVADSWYKYTATCSGAVLFQITTTNGALAQILRSDGCSATAKSAATAYSGTGRTIAVTSGEVLYVRAGLSSYLGYLVPVTSSFTLTCSATPANDKKTGAQTISGTGKFPFNTKGATTDSCESDVFFVWTATCTGIAKVSTCGLLAPSVPANYAYYSLINQAGDTTGCQYTMSTCTSATDASSSRMPVIQGQQYYISVGSDPARSLEGSFDLSCQPESLSATNTDCGSAAPIDVGITSIDPSTSPVYRDLNNVYRPLWYSFTPTCNGYVMIKHQALCGTSNPKAYFGAQSECKFDVNEYRSIYVGSEYDLLYIEEGRTIYLDAGSTTSTSSGYTIYLYQLCGLRGGGAGEPPANTTPSDDLIGGLPVWAIGLIAGLGALLLIGAIVAIVIWRVRANRHESSGYHEMV